jgi:hypothetical protein
MIRTTRLAATSVAALTLSMTGAAACTVDVTANTRTCTGTNVGFTDNVASRTITVEDAAAVTDSGRAIDLTGANQTLRNAGTIESTGNDAIRSGGAASRVENDGNIFALNRGIRLRNDADGTTIVNGVDGVIRATDRGIASENADLIANVKVENHGIIESLNARALQLRGTGTTVINHGAMTGGEEVIEGRLDFTLENTGTIVIREGVREQDGVQFASGTVKNWNLIQGSDDGIDVDEGTIWNYATGQIISKPAATDTDRAGNAIDADVLLQDESLAEASQAQARLLTIHNAGLIRGPRAISGAEGRTGRIKIDNTGTLEGTDTAAVDFALTMAGSLVKLSGGSSVIGSVLMTDQDDVVEIGALASGKLLTNITDDLIAVFDGRGGVDHVDLSAYRLGDIVSLGFHGNSAVLSLLTAGGFVQGTFLNFAFWKVGDVTYSTEELASLRPVPVPAGLPLLGAGLGALWLLRRRRAA